jgi:hypothetical protein
MAVAQDQRIGGRSGGDLGQAAWRWTFAEIEHKALALCLDGKAGRTFLSDPGNKPQHRPIAVHIGSTPKAFGWRPAKIDKPALTTLSGTPYQPRNSRKKCHESPQFIEIAARAPSR